MYLIKNKVMIMFLYEFLYQVSMRKSAPEVAVKFLVFSTFSINFFMKTLLKSII